MKNGIELTEYNRIDGKQGFDERGCYRATFLSYKGGEIEAFAMVDFIGWNVHGVMGYHHGEERFLEVNDVNSTAVPYFDLAKILYDQLCADYKTAEEDTLE